MLNPFSEPAYLLPPLVLLAVSFVLMVVVWRGTQRNFSSLLFLGLLLSIGLWGLLVFGMRASPDIHRALLWERMLPPASYATFVLFYHFTLAYTNAKGQRAILLASYLLLVTIAALSQTDLLIKGMRLEDYGYAPSLGPAVYPLGIIGPILMVGGAYNLRQRYKISLSSEERNRILYLLIAALFPLVGAFLDSFTNLPPASIWTSLIFCIICSVAILKYHLLDIRVVIRKSLAYLLVSLMIAIPYVGILFLLTQVLQAGTELWLVQALIILLLAMALRPLYSRVQQMVDRLF